MRCDRGNVPFTYSHAGEGRRVPREKYPPIGFIASHVSLACKRSVLYADDGGVQFLAEPFAMADLAAALRALGPHAGSATES